MSVLVVIPAAGSGSRFGGEIPKQFRQLAGQPVLLNTIERFFMTQEVAQIVVAVAEPLLANVKQTDRVRFVAGGATRQDSVTNAFRAAEGAYELVAVHDAVRPFFRLATFRALLEAAREHGASIPVMPLTDTINEVRDGAIARTLDRTALVAAQTPQCFRYEVLRDVLEKGGSGATDEASLAARLGYTVRVLPGDPHNIKITHPDDLALAEQHFEEWSTA
jgi:2-C-methyl-D-erythritol 4-phosphate cytidylyltransferase / 2-C-methyl-D-erythritol 2,4-cyclodiphosphate synthase